MAKQSITLVYGVMLEQQEQLTLTQLAQATGLNTSLIIEMIEAHLIYPEGYDRDTWRFNSQCFKRVKTAASFYHDLEINLNGIAMALELLEKIERLEKQLEQLEKLSDR